MNIKQVVLTVIWKMLEDIHVYELMFLHELLGNPSSTQFMKPNMLRMIPWVEPCTIFHVIESHPSFMQNCGTSATSALISSAHGWLPWSFWISYTCANIFNLLIHSYTLHFGKAPFPYFAKSLWWILAPGITSAHENWINACCSFQSIERPH